MNWTNVFTAWGEKNPDGRAATLDAAITHDIYYADPHTGPLKGRENFEQMIKEFGKMMPDGAAVARDDDGYKGHARATVEFQRGNQTFMTGQYFAQLDAAGRITHLIGFSSMPTQ